MSTHTDLHAYPLAPEDPTDLIRDSKYHSEFFTITPKVATHWLDEFNNKNRRLSRAVAERYAAEIRAGKWMTSHQGIGISDELELLDGQHRLYAIELADMPVVLNVTWNLDKNLFQVIDTQKRRTSADSLEISGLFDKNIISVRATLGFLYTLENYTFEEFSSLRTPITNATLVSYAETVDRDKINQAVQMARSYKYVNTTILAVVIYRLLTKDIGYDYIEESFIRPLATGVGTLSTKDPRVVAKAYLDGKVTGRSTSRARLLGYTVVCTAWNEYHAGKSRAFYRHPTEYPDDLVMPFC